METTRRSRRSALDIESDRLTDAIVERLGRDVRATRIRRRLTQARLGEIVDLSQSEISRIELGEGRGVSIAVWMRLATALGRNVRFEFARDPREEPVDAGHLQVKQLLLRLATATGRPGRFELPIGRGDPGLSVDVFVRDDARRMLIVEEAWNSIRDIGGGARSFQRKIALAEDVGVAIGGEAPYVPRGVWAVRATRGNRALVARFPEVFARFFPGSSRHWVDAILSGSEPPAEPGLVWCNIAATRLYPWRRSYSTTTPARSSAGSG